MKSFQEESNREAILQDLHSIRQSIAEAQEKDLYPLHMPGHKRRGFSGMHREALWENDWTEIPGLDDLHAPSGAIARSMGAWAKWVGAAEARYLVNGSSGGIWAALYAALYPGERILVARNAHRSVFGALEILQLDPVFYLPPWIEDWGIWGSVSPTEVERILREDPSIRAVLVTSPTYEGVLSDLVQLADVCRAAQVLLIVDAAHGAHLRESSRARQDAVSAGADLVVESLHKTLPALTPAAVLYRSERIDPRRFSQGLRLFQTSSPSYPLLASIEACLADLVQDQKQSHLRLEAEWERVVERLQKTLQMLQILQVHCQPGRDREKIWAHDFQKLLVRIPPGFDAQQADLWMRSEGGIQWEMVQAHTLLGILTPADCGAGLLKIAEGLTEYDTVLLRQKPFISSCAEKVLFSGWTLPERVYTAGQARRLVGKRQNYQDSLGCVSQEMIFAYPPGIPLILPGERISEAHLQYWKTGERRGVQWQTESGSWPWIQICDDLSSLAGTDLTRIRRENTIE